MKVASIALVITAALVCLTGCFDPGDDPDPPKWPTMIFAALLGGAATIARLVWVGFRARTVAK